MPKFTYIRNPRPRELFDLDKNKIKFGQEVSTVFLKEATPVGPVVDPVLENNDWDVIKLVCESGDAANYWAVGDVKKVTGGDTYERDVKIVDMTGLYGKHVVFQFFGLNEDSLVWNSSSNVDDDSAYNNYNIADIRAQLVVGSGTALSNVCSSELAGLFTDTTVKVAKNGNSSTLLEVTDKVFLPAEREVWTTNSYSVQAEFDALATFEYWQTNTANSDHVMKQISNDTARSYWLRSPHSGYAGRVCNVDSDGSASYGSAGSSLRVSLCFSF